MFIQPRKQSRRGVHAFHQVNKIFQTCYSIYLHATFKPLFSLLHLYFQEATSKILHLQLKCVKIHILYLISFNLLNQNVLIVLFHNNEIKNISGLVKFYKMFWEKKYFQAKLGFTELRFNTPSLNLAYTCIRTMQYDVRKTWTWFWLVCCCMWDIEVALVVVAQK